MLVGGALTACGGSSAPAGESGKSANQILADVAAAFSKVHSFHIEGTQVDSSGRSLLSGDVEIPGSMRMRLALGNQTVGVILLGSDVYVIANEPFWAAHTHIPAIVANALANKWIKAPGSVANSFGHLKAFTDPSTLTRCIFEHHGTITLAGTATDGSQRVLVLRDAGNVPGDSPGDLHVPISGPPLPVRAIQTGPTRPGGKPDPTCGDVGQQDTTKASDITFSAYNKPVDITPPANSIALPTPGATA